MQKGRIINYNFESIDLNKYCRSYLMEHNYLENDELTNLNLVERSLINYSIVKLTADWNFNSSNIKENANSLLDISKIIDTTITTNKEKENYFSAYIYYILYIFSAISSQSPINWIKNEECPKDEIFFNYDKDLIIEVITNPNTNIYEVPSKLLEKFKNFYIQKEDPKAK